jgi:hypothetical protein
MTLYDSGETLNDYLKKKIDIHYLDKIAQTTNNPEKFHHSFF